MKNKLQTPTFWLTGLSAAGKSTLSIKLREHLIDKGHNVEVIDGDVLRQTVSKNLSFSPTDRSENIKIAATMASKLVREGIIPIVAMISPSMDDRQKAGDLIGSGFLEIYVKCPVDICINRDPKGLYAKALDGVVHEVTGLDAPYDHPMTPHLVIDTAVNDVEKSINILTTFADLVLNTDARRA
jgi:adenylyl-sulfate kinase